jgi:sarcosine oxidase subunit delta
MRIPCPFCGARDISEFAYLGDATVVRPSPDAPNALSQFLEAVYLRDNPRGPHSELWYHASGCRAWLRVERDTATHVVASAALARPASQ